MQRKLLKWVLVSFIILLLIYLFLVFLYFDNTRGKNQKQKCVRIQTTYCPCNMGGSEKCVLESETEEYLNKIKNCPEDLICTALYNCRIKECVFKNERCVELG